MVMQYPFPINLHSQRFMMNPVGYQPLSIFKNSDAETPVILPDVIKVLL